jgi:hypothetical protein
VRQPVRQTDDSDDARIPAERLGGRVIQCGGTCKEAAASGHYSARVPGASRCISARAHDVVHPRPTSFTQAHEP